MTELLKTGINNVRNVQRYILGYNSLASLCNILEAHRKSKSDEVVFFVDEFFEGESKILSQLPLKKTDEIIFVKTKNEPTTEYIDELVIRLRDEDKNNLHAIVGMGGGSTMDVAKAVSNLLTNGGKAEDYQGWDLVKIPGIFKIAVPTISGTGAEATRTCVMTNKKNGLKLGMNSEFTVYDQLILDPSLTRTVPRNQYFFTGMDAYIHCIESLSGTYRNAIGDAFSRESLNLCRKVFNSKDMMSDEGLEQLMVASYLGGCAIATSYVGLVHPFSAGLSIVLGHHHCVANCITMRAMEEFYPKQFQEFWEMAEKQKVYIPLGVCKDLTNEQFEKLYDATIIHEKPLTNALGENFHKILTQDKVREVFLKM